jgi:hypothetical protein
MNDKINKTCLFYSDMISEDPWAGFVLAAVFILIGFAFRFKPGWIAKDDYTKHGFGLASRIIPNRRLILILKFIGLAFLLMGFVAFVISLNAMK